MSKNYRPIDRTAKQSYSWWGKSFVFIKKTEIKTWQAVFIIAFIAGIATTLVWTISNSLHPFSRAAITLDSRPDFIVSDITTASSTNGTSILKVNINNIGSDYFDSVRYNQCLIKTSDNQTLMASPYNYDSGAPISDGNYKQGRIFTCIFNVDFSKIQWVSATVEPNNKINESNEINNTLTKTLSTATSTPISFSLRVSRINDYIGGTVKITSKSFNVASYTAGVSNHDADEVVTLVATPKAGYIFNSWTGDCNTVNGAICIVKMDRNKEIGPYFAKPSFSLRVVRDNNYIGGTVKITSQSFNAETYTAGLSNYGVNEVVTLFATPKDGYIFNGWSGDCYRINKAKCWVKMNGDKIVTTDFGKK